MGNKPRCPQCNHLRGPRGLDVAKDNPKRKAHVGQARKAPCACTCHGEVPA